MQPSSFKTNLWPLASIFWVSTLLYLCLTPAPPQLEGPLGWDKLQHAGAFGLLALLVFKSFMSFQTSLPFSSFFACFIASTVGGVVELLQGWLTVNRTADFFDFLADTLGAITVILFIYFTSGQRGES